MSIVALWGSFRPRTLLENFGATTSTTNKKNGNTKTGNTEPKRPCITYLNGLKLCHSHRTAIPAVFVFNVSDAPTLVTNQSPDTLQYFGRRRYGYRLNSKRLRAVDSDTDSSSLLYVMAERPRHGHIENTVAKRYVRRRFTQRDLDEDSLLFIIDPKTSATNDTFTFRVEDSRGNTLDDQR